MRDTTEGRVPRGTVWETDDIGVKVEVVVELEGALEATLARASGGEMQQELIPGGQPTMVWTGEEGGFKRLHGMQELGAGRVMRCMVLLSGGIKGSKVNRSLAINQ